MLWFSLSWLASFILGVSVMLVSEVFVLVVLWFAFGVVVFVVMLHGVSYC